MRSEDAKRRARLERKWRRLGHAGRCVVCGEDDLRCLEAHHVAGQANDPAMIVPVCANCHARLSWEQSQWPEGLIRGGSRDRAALHGINDLAREQAALIARLLEGLE